MAEKKVGILVREARTGAGLTQDRLAKTVGEGLTAADISKCERGEKDLSNAQLKKIAVACGVTQTSLVNAPKNLSETKTASRGTAGKTAASGKTGTAGKTTASASGKTAAKTTASASGKAAKTTAKTTAARKSSAPAGANISVKVTATEQKLLEAYRAAPADLKKAGLRLLKGEYGDTVLKLLEAAPEDSGTDWLGSLLGGGLGDIGEGLLGKLFR